jgi:uncharacterized protein (UPF0276 family)
MRRLGLGYRSALHDGIVGGAFGVNCLEITAEHFFDSGPKQLQQLAESFDIFVHGLGLSLGTPGPLDRETLRQFARVARDAKAEWISEHVAFTRTSEVDLGHLNPVPRTREALRVLVDHALEVSAYCQRPLLLENITFDLQLGGELSEPDFLNRLCEEARCQLLLDVTNLYINSKNHQFDAERWLQEIEPAYIAQLHIVGYTVVDKVYRDYHAAPMQPDLLDLLRVVLDYASVKAIVLERDAGLANTREIADELCKLQAIING